MLLDAKADPTVVDELYGTALQAACFEGNIENVRLLMPGSSKTARPCGPFDTVLCAAIYGHHKSIVELLLSNGWDVNGNTGQRGRSIPLLVAMAEGRLDIIELLLNRDVDIKVTDADESTPLILGAGSLPARAIELLVQRGCDITEQNMDGVNPLIAASKARATETVQLLLDLNAERGFWQKKVDINHCSDGRSALHFAARNGDAETCKILVRAGASVQSNTSQTPPTVYAAAASGDLETFDFIYMLPGWDLGKYRKRWGDVLAPALLGRNPDIYDLFLEDTDRDINAMLNEEAGSALHMACLHNLPDLVRELLDRGADPNVKGGKYHTTLQAASFRGKPNIVRMLLDQGFDAPSSLDGFYGNALNAAANKNHVAVMRMLIDVAEPEEYFGALSHAVEARAKNAVDFLLRTILLNNEAKLGVLAIPFEDLFQALEEDPDEEMENSDDWLIEDDQAIDPEDEEANFENFLDEHDYRYGEESLQEGWKQDKDDGLFVVEDIRRSLEAAQRRAHERRVDPKGEEANLEMILSEDEYGGGEESLEDI